MAATWRQFPGESAPICDLEWDGTVDIGEPVILTWNTMAWGSQVDRGPTLSLHEPYELGESRLVGKVAYQGGYGYANARQTGFDESRRPIWLPMTYVEDEIAATITATISSWEAWR
jgi:hypothetical protein